MGKGGGGGGLRILPHKSWNVYNKDNILKVKRDEAKHAQEEAEKRVRKEKADAEFRMALLRKRAVSIEPAANRAEGVDGDDQLPALEAAVESPLSRKIDVAAAEMAKARASRILVVDGKPNEAKISEHAQYEPLAPPPSSKHINLFEDVEESKIRAQQAQSKEDAKKKKELERAKQLCPDVFFAHSQLDPETGELPWYSRGLTKQETLEEKKEFRKGMEKSRFSKVLLDPLGDINRSLGSSIYASAVKEAHAAKIQDAINAAMEKAGAISTRDPKKDPLAPRKGDKKSTSRWDKDSAGTHIEPPPLEDTRTPEQKILDRLRKAGMSVMAFGEAAKAMTASESAADGAEAKVESVSGGGEVKSAATTSSSNSAPLPITSNLTGSESSHSIPTPTTTTTTSTAQTTATTITSPTVTTNQVDISNKRQKSARHKEGEISVHSVTPSMPKATGEGGEKSQHHSSSSSSSSSSSDSEAHHKKKKKKKEKEKKRDKGEKKEKKSHRSHSSSSKKRKHHHSRSPSPSAASKKKTSIDHHHNKNSDGPPPLQRLKSTAELRAERMKRERTEMEKVAQLLDVPVYAVHDEAALRFSKARHEEDGKKYHEGYLGHIKF